MADTKIDDFTRAYLTAALWTSDPNPGSGEWCEHDDWTIDNIDAASIAEAIADCKDFRDQNRADLEQAGDDAQNGHDFFLTRNGHGAGFWDRGYGEIGARLTDAAHAFGTHEAEDELQDGRIYFHN